MANALIGPSVYDHTFLAHASLLTTTSQYRCVGFLDGGADFTVYLANTTTVQPMGVNQTLLSSSAEALCTVRLLGISKVFAAASVNAGHFVTRSGEGLVLGRLSGLTGTAVSTTSEITILGQALQTGITNQAITIFVNPSRQEKNYAA